AHRRIQGQKGPSGSALPAAAESPACDDRDEAADGTVSGGVQGTDDVTVAVGDRSSKLQTPSSREAPSTKHQRAQLSRLPLELGCLEFLWCLELGIWSFILLPPCRPRKGSSPSFRQP